ncbi:MAG: hypothetical protein IPJ79_15805 [Bacteroidetes bacterium]|nr:hypothetical protein [Bacteroidota bacterium]HNR19114.1 hypothetical protein [Bacteroidia bacterium]HNU33670.1 hypothetical protein [Bacteroidia bacterium]
MHSHSHAHSHEHKPANVYVLIPVIICFLITHFNSEKITAMLASFSYDAVFILKLLAYIIPFKISAYFICIAIIAFPFIRELKKYSRFKVKDIGIALGVWFLFFAAFFNLMPMSMGYGYAEMSVHPFDMQTGWYYKRLLMPALAYITGFRNITPYLVFSQILSLLLILFTYNYIKHTLQHISTTFRILVLASVCSLEFICFLFFHPGYADHLLCIILLCAYCFNFSERSLVALFILGLCTHELSLFVFMPLILLKLKGKTRIIASTIAVLYVSIYALSFNFNFDKLFAVHAVENKPALLWVIENPLLVLFGIAISFKLLWMVVIKGMMSAPAQQGQMMLALVVSSLILCLLGVDTSRMMAFCFPALLLALPVFYQKVKPAFANALMVANLLIPYFSVSIPSGILSALYFQELFTKLF